MSLLLLLIRELMRLPGALSLNCGCMPWDLVQQRLESALSTLRLCASPGHRTAAGDAAVGPRKDYTPPPGNGNCRQSSARPRISFERICQSNSLTMKSSTLCRPYLVRVTVTMMAALLLIEAATRLIDRSHLLPADQSSDGRCASPSDFTADNLQIEYNHSRHYVVHSLSVLF